MSIKLIIVPHLIIVAPPVPSPPPPAPIGVQALCSVVVWYSPEVSTSCEDLDIKLINGYEVRFYDPELIQSNVTKYVGANRTFYILTEEDRLAGDDKTYVQVIASYTLSHTNVIESHVFTLSLNYIYYRFEFYAVVKLDSGAMASLWVRICQLYT